MYFGSDYEFHAGPLTRESAAALNALLRELRRVSNIIVSPPLMQQDVGSGILITANPTQGQTGPTGPTGPAGPTTPPPFELFNDPVTDANWPSPCCGTNQKPCDCSNYTGYSGPYITFPVSTSSSGQTFTASYQFYICGMQKNDSYLTDSKLTTRTDDYDGVITVNQSCSAASVSNGGTGYAVCDVLTSTGGTCAKPVKVQVTAVSAGVITAVAIVDPGECSAPPSNPVSFTGGSGSSAALNLTFPANPISNSQTFRLYWPCGYQDVKATSVTGNAVTFTGSGGNPLPASSTEIVTATAGNCC